MTAKRASLSMALILVLCLASSAAAQYATSDCEENRGRVRTGSVSGLSVDPSNPGGTPISFDEFVARTYPNADDRTLWPSEIAPQSRVVDEGTIFVIDNVEAGGFYQCETAVGLEFTKPGDVGGYDFGKFYGEITHENCRPPGAAEAIAKAYTTYSRELSVWRSIWDDAKCGYFGGENTPAVRVIGVAFWDDQSGTSTPRLSLSPILAIIPMDGGGDTPGGGGTTPPPPPPPVQFQIPIELEIEPLVLANSGSHKITFSTAVGSSFNSDLHLAVETDAFEHEDFHASITPAMIPAPGVGEGELTITTGPLAFPRVYSVKLIASTNDQAFSRTFLVQVLCDPPMILGTNQPKSVTAANGAQVTLEVTPSGTGPFFYQWYKGVPGMTRNPVLAANESKLTFTTRETATYWVRVSNACGSVNSTGATVTTTGTLSGPARRRGGRS